MPLENSTAFPTRNILFLSTEVYPYAKTGGLADVSAALPQALRELGHDVRIMMPKYGFIGEKKQKIHLVNRLQGMEFNIGGNKTFVNAKSSAILTAKTRIQIYLLENDDYFQRMGLYVDPETGRDYPDNDERFMLYDQSIFETCKRMLWKPDIIHCNDWQCGLVPAYLKSRFLNDPFFVGTKSLFTIHNMAFQGVFPKASFAKSGLPEEMFSPKGVEFYEHFSFLKAGLQYADAITTVSPTYSQEIRTEEYGNKLEGVLQKRRKDLHGILNGIDLDVWDPTLDKNIVKPFSTKDLSGKEECKRDLCYTMSIPYEEGRAVLGVIARLSDQKGFDLIAEVMDRILASGAQVVVLGSGEKKYGAYLTQLQKRTPDRVGVYVGFHDNLAHKIEAGADMYLMPSKYEPCGLNQMYSMHYGTVPIVRATGGLADTVVDHADGTKRKPATGFCFSDYNAGAFWRAIERALHVYHTDKAEWRALQLAGMERDFSWQRSARQYADLYEKLLLANEISESNEV